MSFDGMRAVGEPAAMALGQLQARGTQVFIDEFRDELTMDDVDTLHAVAAATARWLMTRSALEIPVPVDSSFFADSPMIDAAGLDEHDVSDADDAALTWEHPLREVASFLGTCLEPDVLRRHELRLLAGYHAALVASGVDYYDFDACLDDYRLGQLAGPVTTMTALPLESPRSSGSRERVLTEVRRSCAAIRELRSLRLVAS